MKSAIEAFTHYLRDQGRSYDHIKNIQGRLRNFAQWTSGCGKRNVEDVSPDVVQRFLENLRSRADLSAKTRNHYLDAIHNFFGYAIYKRQWLTASNPAATGRQARLDRCTVHATPPPTIYPDQINAIIEEALKHGDRQVVNLIVFICEGGFRIQELQFLPVGDIDLVQREIVLDVKRPDPKRVRPELRRRCLSPDGFWSPKSLAGRRVIHITDRLASLIRSMGQGDPSDWVFMNQAGNQVAANKTLVRLKRYALDVGVLVSEHPKTGRPCSLIRWHWLRHYHRTRAHVSKIRRDVSKIAMGHAADSIHDHYRGVDVFAFHEEYAKFASGIDAALLEQK